MAQRPGNSGGSGGAKPRTSTSSSSKAPAQKAPTSRAVVPRGSNQAAVPRGRVEQQTMLAPKGYTMHAVQPAKNYDVISFARAMNRDEMGPRVQKLFDAEKEAALEAQRTGIYIGWRCPEFKWDCQRVGPASRCFCGHILSQHDKYNGHSVRVPCRQSGCACKAFAFVPSRPEDVGEFWLPKRRDFDAAAWRCVCRCKHNHEEHDPNGSHRCKKCGCGLFSSSSVCAACDRHWEEHETCFDTTDSRREKGMPYGEDYLPFAEIPSLRNMVLTGEDDGDMTYMKLQERQLAPGAPRRALPPPDDPRALQYGGRDPDAGPSPYGGRQDPRDPRSGGRGGPPPGRDGFRPVYD